MLMKMPHRRFLFLLTIVLGIEFVVLAIAPNDRKDWLLENVLVVLFVGAMYASYRKLTLSRISYLLIFLFLSLHLVGRALYVRAGALRPLVRVADRPHVQQPGRVGTQ